VSPIVWELGLVIVCVVGFAVWQSVTLKRDMRITQEEKRRRAAQSGGAAPGRDGDGGARAGDGEAPADGRHGHRG